MKKIVTALALAIALPSVAHAQQTAEPATPMPCCEKMKAEGKECGCCKDMDHADHADHGGAESGAGSAPPAPHSH